MNLIVIMDTETTGLPVWNEPSGSECQPHMAQLAAVLIDANTRKVVSAMDVIIRPDGWEIPQEITDIHGISQEHALAVGVPEEVALDMLLAICGMNAGVMHKRVAYNKTFDQRIIRIACKRYRPDAITELWADKDNFECAMIRARKVLKAPKNLKLVEAYKELTGKELENAHSAMADTLACMEVYWELENREGRNPL